MDRMVQCKRNNRFVQPTTPLGAHINSHAVPADEWLRLYRRMAHLDHSVELRTEYQSSSVRLRVTHDHPNGAEKKVYDVSFNNDRFLVRPGLEFVGENVYMVKPDAFPVQLEYNHERQSVVHVFRTGALRVELDGLLEGIATHAERTRTQVMDDHYRLSEEAFSLSFRMYLEQNATADEVQRGLLLLEPPKTALGLSDRSRSLSA